MSKSIETTSALIDAAIRELEMQNPLLGIGAFKRLQKVVGMKFDKSRILLSRYKDQLDLRASRFTDWFHDLVVSGGVFQYALNSI